VLAGIETQPPGASVLSSVLPIIPALVAGFLFEVRMITTSLHKLAARFMNLKEVAGTTHSPQIMAMLHLDANWPSGDEVPWCSAFVNYCAWLLDLPRSKSLAARS